MYAMKEYLWSFKLGIILSHKNSKYYAHHSWKKIITVNFDIIICKPSF